MQREFKRQIEDLESLFSFVTDFVAGHDIDEQTTFQLNLVVEELFTNLVRHNTGGGDHILVTLDRNGDQLRVTLKDFEVEPLGSQLPGRVDTRQSLSERKAGGLGIHLVRNMFNKLSYEYKDRTLVVTALKNLEEKNV